MLKKENMSFHIKLVSFSYFNWLGLSGTRWLKACIFNVHLTKRSLLFYSEPSCSLWNSFILKIVLVYILQWLIWLQSKVRGGGLGAEFENVEFGILGMASTSPKTKAKQLCSSWNSSLSNGGTLGGSQITLS